MKKAKQKNGKKTHEDPKIHPSSVSPTSEEIQQRAHQIYLARGSVGTGDLEDWLQAEQELKGARNTSAI
jgi:hypothetical protein